jgi:hypothetical protein
MKPKKYYFVLAAVTAIFCVLAFGNVKSRPAIERRVMDEPPFERGLIGPPSPALVGIEELYVDIRHASIDPNKDGLVWKELRAKVEHKLTEAGIKMYSGNVRGAPLKPGTPILTVDIDMLKLKKSKRYVFSTETSLSRLVRLPIKQRLAFKAEVWKKSSSLRTVDVENMPAVVTGVVMEQVEAFIHGYIATNQKYVHRPDANDVGTSIQNDLPRPPPGLLATKYNYVASKNSKVFHKPDCSSAARIAPKNLIGYNAREEAIRAGKRPCKICKP